MKVMVTDGISDMLTRIRNASRRNHKYVSFPHSIIKEKILEIILKDGFIYKYEIIEKNNNTLKDILVHLRYHKNESAIIDLQRLSRPGMRRYFKVNEIPYVYNGRGIAIVSTSKGILSDLEARKLNVGGEVLLTIW